MLHKYWDLTERVFDLIAWIGNLMYKVLVRAKTVNK
jgi:hypothetical protein